MNIDNPAGTDHKQDPQPGLRVTGTAISIRVVARAKTTSGHDMVLLVTAGRPEWMTLKRWQEWWGGTDIDDSWWFTEEEKDKSG